MDADLGKRLAICQQCPRRQPVCDGDCDCLEDSKGIISHAQSLGCPLGYFESRLSPNVPSDSPDADLQSAITAPPELLGDKIAVLAEKWGADKLAAAYERMTGLPCGCAGRRELLNRLDGWMREVVKVKLL